MRRGLLIAGAALGLVGAACSPQSVSTQQADRPTPTPVTAVDEPTATPTAAETFSATNKLATMIVTVNASSVAAGGEWTADVELRNDRAEPLIYGDGPCGAFAALTMTVPLPLEPQGVVWSGLEASFKSFALEKGRAFGDGPPTDPMIQYVSDQSCGDPPGTFAELGPGASVSTTVTWKAELIGGLDALAGPVDFSITTGIDPDRTERPPPPPGGGPMGSWIPMYKALTVDGVLTVEEGDQHPISIGQAIDALLGDARFTSWLAAQPEGTCTGVNVLLQGGQAGSLLPVGPNWVIDVFCENGVPRHFAISTIDPFTGEVTGVNRCDVPCDR